MLPDQELVDEVQRLFSEKLMVEVESPDADLLQAGILDSLRLVELIFHLEQTAGFTVAMDR